MVIKVIIHQYNIIKRCKYAFGIQKRVSEETKYSVGSSKLLKKEKMVVVANVVDPTKI